MTLTSGIPITTADVTAAGTLYFTPHGGDKIGLFDGTRWKIYSFTEISLALTLTSGNNYDVWLYDNAGTLTLETLIWTNNTTRATALVLQNGVYCKTGALTRRYLGTIRSSAANVTEDSAAKRFVWNYYNRVKFRNFRRDTTDSWTNAGNGTWSAMNSGNAAWKHEFVRGFSEDAVIAALEVSSRNTSGSYPSSAVAIDSTTAIDSTLTAMSVNGGTVVITTECQFVAYPTIGYHYIQGVQTTSDSPSATWYGDNGGFVGGGQVAINSGFITEGMK